MTDEKGLCRKKSPEMAEDGKSIWPVTLDFFWCGEYEMDENNGI